MLYTRAQDMNDRNAQKGLAQFAVLWWATQTGGLRVAARGAGTLLGIGTWDDCRKVLKSTFTSGPLMVFSLVNMLKSV